MLTVLDFDRVAQSDSLDDMTQEEFDSLVWENDHFSGHVFDLERLRTAQEIAADLGRLKEICPQVVDLQVNPPDQHNPHILICMDVRVPVDFDSERMKLMQSAIQKADNMVFGAANGNLRMSLFVYDVWGR